MNSLLGTTRTSTTSQTSVPVPQPTAPATIQVPSVSASTSYTRDLSIGSAGADVAQLQQFLITKNAGPAAIVLCSLGTAGTSGIFGPMTKAALKEYQASVGIAPATGYFGPTTRAFVSNQVK